ncbi:hypothetical protein COU00_00375 [Candidatus Falkowbacteria bacterium CG10_big_fil_rev_8_21_14_0_10_43_11]|uniref:Uncharacterized protein n=1 Tax=Candidatus Falkowbacteria bacterium CG10_big_fil_rev_8_21_14_0_10_43_11 TaxID=1974568 RepID=A0A2M6WN04_9BACT|nr:MAG: hypothetical protein COU00_00375 [Candidatus Falkowbacteria bacterium CG10_big_fil_rev_8_21_14_0_10_43_11]
MNQNLGSERFWQDTHRWEARQWQFDILLFLSTAILLSQMGCAYLQAPPRYKNLDQALAGAPNAGRMSATDAQEILSLQERQRAQEFEKNLTAKFISSSSASVAANGADGLPGKIRNHSRWETVTFLVIGPTTKTFALYPGEIKEFFLPVGEYVCKFIRGSHELCRPWTFHVDDKLDYFFGEQVFWGLYYQDY